jgi:threonylcarbamoyladenosine tRNA methylthiotransferase MtaB
MRVFFTNLGCKLNRAELERTARQFVAAGHGLASSLAEADLHVINTCTVTHLAARDSRKAARRGSRLNPLLKTVLTGCYSTASPDKAACVLGVDLVVPNREKDNLVERVHEAFPDHTELGNVGGSLEMPYVPLDFGNSRALVKIEDGCNMTCAFCIIPLVRGQQKSRPIGEVVKEVQELVRAGSQEIVLTGVQISSYRSEGMGLFDLTDTVLQTTAVPRLRLTSIAPWQFDLRLLELVATNRLCRHFHLSLQSGSDATLQRMRRPHTATRFRQLVETIRDRVPEVAITTDLIIGFPGETETEFEESLRFTETMNFARVHVFPYSSRPGTEAALMPDQIPHATKRHRMARMLEVARVAERRFWETQLGTSVDVLWEDHRRGVWVGMTDNYIRVFSSVPQGVRSLSRARLALISESGVATVPEPRSAPAAVERDGPSPGRPAATA